MKKPKASEEQKSQVKRQVFAGKQTKQVKERLSYSKKFLQGA